MTEDEKKQVTEFYEQEQKRRTYQAALSQHQLQLIGQAKAASNTTAGSFSAPSWVSSILSPNNSIQPIWEPTPTPPRDVRIEYLEQRVKDLMEQLMGAENERMRAVSMEAQSALKVIELHRLEDFLRNSYPEVLAEFDTVQSAIKRITT